MPAVASASKVNASSAHQTATSRLTPPSAQRVSPFSDLLDSGEPRPATTRGAAENARDARDAKEARDTRNAQRRARTDEPASRKDRSAEKPADRPAPGTRSDSRQDSAASDPDAPQDGAHGSTNGAASPKDAEPASTPAAADTSTDAAPDTSDDTTAADAAAAMQITLPATDAATPAAAIALPIAPGGETAAANSAQDGGETLILPASVKSGKAAATATPDSGLNAAQTQTAEAQDPSQDGAQDPAQDPAQEAAQNPAASGDKAAARTAGDISRLAAAAQGKTADHASGARDSATINKLPDGSPAQTAPQATPHAATPLHTAATGAAQANAAPAPAPASVPIAGLAVEIAARASAGKNRFEIRLDPPELGKIDVRLDIDKHGHVTSRLIVEKAETLDLLRRDAPQLERALQDAGLKTSGDGLQFSLQQQTPQERDDNHHPTRTAEITVTDETIDATLVQRGYARLAAARGGVDIRI